MSGIFWGLSFQCISLNLVFSVTSSLTFINFVKEIDLNIECFVRE